MNGEERVVITEAVEILKSVVKNKSKTYTLITEFKGETTFHKVDREKQLESVIEWAIDHISGNVDLNENN